MRIFDPLMIIRLPRSLFPGGMGLHGNLLNPLFRMNDFHLRVDRREPGQPGVFEGDPDGKIDLHFRQSGHLAGFGFVEVWICARRDHDRNVYETPTDLFHKVFLR